MKKLNVTVMLVWSLMMGLCLPAEAGPLTQAAEPGLASVPALVKSGQDRTGDLRLKDWKPELEQGKAASVKKEYPEVPKLPAPGTAPAGQPEYFGLVARRGQVGQVVLAIQAMLRELQLYNLQMGGSCGPGTEAAVKAFERRHHKTERGVVDEVLYNLMKDESKLDFAKFQHRAVMDTTAYSSEDPGLGEYTAPGARVQKGVIAVDPDIIPLGTMVYVLDYGYALAADIGGDIQGYILDLAFDSHQDALDWGSRETTVYW